MEQCVQTAGMKKDEFVPGVFMNVTVSHLLNLPSHPGVIILILQMGQLKTEDSKAINPGESEPRLKCGQFL